MFDTITIINIDSPVFVHNGMTFETTDLQGDGRHYAVFNGQLWQQESPLGQHKSGPFRPCPYTGSALILNLTAQLKPYCYRLAFDKGEVTGVEITEITSNLHIEDNSTPWRDERSGLSRFVSADAIYKVQAASNDA